MAPASPSPGGLKKKLYATMHEKAHLYSCVSVRYTNIGVKQIVKYPVIIKDILVQQTRGILSFYPALFATFWGYVRSRRERFVFDVDSTRDDDDDCVCQEVGRESERSKKMERGKISKL